MEARRPPPLRPGARVGVFAPSSPASTYFKERFKHALDVMSNSLGVEPVVADSCYVSSGFVSAPAEVRAKELTSFLNDDSIDAVFCTTGGFNSSEILNFVDFSSISGKPKPVVGYSDCTSLLLAINARLGWVTYYGPAVMTQFGEFPTILPFTLESFREVMGQNKQFIHFADPEFWTDERLEWGNGDWLQRPRNWRGPATRLVLRRGIGSGTLWGGNIETMNFLAGTRFWRPPEKIVLFVEAVEAEAFLPRVRRSLTHLLHCGVFDRTQALLVGRSPDALDLDGETLESTILDVLVKYDFPIVANLAFGHTDPIQTLPIGLNCEVDTRSGEEILFK